MATTKHTGPTIPNTVRVDDAQYDRPVRAADGTWYVLVYFDDGDHFCTTYVSQDVHAAWANA